MPEAGRAREKRFLADAGRSQVGKGLGGHGKNSFLSGVYGSQGRCNGHDEYGSGDVAGSLHAGSESPAGTSWLDGSGGTSDEFSNKEHRVRQSSFVARVREERENQTGRVGAHPKQTLAGGREHTQAKTRNGGDVKQEATRAYEIDALFV